MKLTLKEIVIWGLILLVLGAIPYLFYLGLSNSVKINALGIRQGLFEQVIVFEKIPHKAEVCVVYKGLLFDHEECAVEEDEDGKLEIGIPDFTEMKWVTIRPFFVFSKELWARNCVPSGITELTCRPFQVAEGE